MEINTEIILSLKPKWCEKIFSGEKNIEVRKTIPRKGLPFRVFVYETKEGKGAIVGEFVVDRVGCDYRNWDEGNSCMTKEELFEYGKGKAYGWCIASYKQYYISKKLSVFGLKRAPQSWCYVRQGKNPI